MLVLRGLVLAVCVAVLSACGGPSVPDIVAAEVVADAPRPVTTPPVDAELVDAGWLETAAWVARAAEDGTPVVVNVFASWCAPCREEAPVLRAAVDQYPGVAFLGIDHQDRREDGAEFIEQEQLPFATLYDFQGEVARALQATGMPATAFFDHTGRLLRVHVGIVTDDLLDTQLDAMLAAAAAADGR